MSINRFSSALSLTIGTTTAATDALLFGEFTMGMIHVPAGASVATLTWYTCATEKGTYLAAYDEHGLAVTQTVAAERAYPIPLSLAGAAFLKPVGDVAQEASVVLKA